MGAQALRRQLSKAERVAKNRLGRASGAERMETLSHEMFVGLSYGVTGVVFVGLVAWVLMTGRRRRAEIARLEAKGSRAL